MAQQVTSVEKIDGRRARGLRTREAIVTALIELIAAGDIAPTAQRIAERASVSVRSVYQHFTDVEGLYADAATRIFEWARSNAKDVDPDWPQQRRIDEFAANRTTTLEMLGPFSRASRLLEPTSTVMRESRLAMQRWAAERVATVFAQELERLDEPARSYLLATLDTMSSAAAWDHLRASGHTLRSGRLVVRAGLAALLASVPVKS